MCLRQIPITSDQEKVSNVEQGLVKGKEAVSLDTGDGQSWSLLGNAYLCHFFQVSQNPKTLKQAMSAYNQAEKDVVAKSSPELHYNRGIALKYEEEFHAALTSFSSASALDPTWSEPKQQTNQMIKYLQVLMLQFSEHFQIIFIPGYCYIDTVKRKVKTEEALITDIISGPE